MDEYLTGCLSRYITLESFASDTIYHNPPILGNYDNDTRDNTTPSLLKTPRCDLCLADCILGSYRECLFIAKTNKMMNVNARS